MQRLSGKTCLITGAAHGIGLAIAQRFVAEGGDVIVTDIDEATGQREAAALNCQFALLDVAREDHWARIAQTFPALDVLVNNAGITGFEASEGPHDPEHASLADWHRVHAVNNDGTFLGCRYAIGAMKARGAGSIINISSRSGVVGIPGAAAYAASKAAIRNHTKSVALYCAQNGWQIRCNSIQPAAIRTRIWEPMIGNGADREANAQAIADAAPLRRFGAPEEVAALAAFLAADESAYMTGAEMTLDGGILAGSSAAPG